VLTEQIQISNAFRELLNVFVAFAGKRFEVLFLGFTADVINQNKKSTDQTNLSSLP